ncbi:hypothetical protein IFM89_038551 [Coptis chinensis]|uniref:Presequence protease mitochondrial-type C-terminal domain-containing protein n=1 Tax=Coptis chinensis TaxID=261450 RepID=A0A835HJH0_9MAGN|nr:hypothetical protein IFM89_038551 [Coptis chinensis]
MHSVSKRFPPSYICSSVHWNEAPCSHIVFRDLAYATDAKHLFTQMKYMLSDPGYTQESFITWVSEQIFELEGQLRERGCDIAERRMHGKLNVGGYMVEQMEGLRFLEWLRFIQKRVYTNWTDIDSTLREVFTSITSKNNCSIHMVVDKEHMISCENLVRSFIAALSKTSCTVSTKLNVQLSRQNEAIVIPTQSAFNPYSSVLTLLSSSDPNLLRTLDTYNGISSFLSKLKIDEDTLKKAIFCTVQKEYVYRQNPGAEAYQCFLRILLSYKEHDRAKVREKILCTSAMDFVELGVALAELKCKSVVVAVTSLNEVEVANEERRGFFEVTHAL